MKESIITTGKSIDLAIAAALAQLGMDRDSVSVEVLENAKTGFLGIGACPAKVKVSYEVPDTTPVPTPALSSASRKTKKQAPRLEKLPELPKEPAPTAAKQPVTVKNPVAAPGISPKQAPKKQAPKLERVQPAADNSVVSKSEIVYPPAPSGSPAERVENFVRGLLEHMGSDAVPHAIAKDDDNISVELVGSSLGMLIGRRGETLDAIQHLTNYALNHDAEKRIRVSIDAENYRGKREEALQHLAEKVAGKVVKYRRNMTLEPMNAYERHVIHATLQDMPEVTTFSTGTEPNRRIVVAYAKDKPETAQQ